MKANLKKSIAGFTLVELMVVVGIIGLLSAVAVPNFKKYQGKAKQSEAKLALAALYTIESSAFSDYNTYLTCLTDIGYDTPASGYYAVGFKTANTATQAGVATLAGLGACSTAATAVTPGTQKKSGGTAPTTLALGSAITASNFTASAEGNIVGTTNDIWSINDLKTLKNDTPGF